MQTIETWFREPFEARQDTVSVMGRRRSIGYPAGSEQADPDVVRLKRHVLKLHETDDRTYFAEGWPRTPQGPGPAVLMDTRLGVVVIAPRGAGTEARKDLKVEWDRRIRKAMALQGFQPPPVRIVQVHEVRALWLEANGPNALPLLLERKKPGARPDRAWSPKAMAGLYATAVLSAEPLGPGWAAEQAHEVVRIALGGKAPQAEAGVQASKDRGVGHGLTDAGAQRRAEDHGLAIRAAWQAADGPGGTAGTRAVVQGSGTGTLGGLDFQTQVEACGKAWGTLLVARVRGPDRGKVGTER